MEGSQGQAFTGALDPATRAILPSNRVTIVHLLRHGEVADLAERVVRGQLDVELSPRGREQSRRLAHWFAQHEPKPDRIFTSDLSRCRELADDLGARVSCTPQIDVRLREQSMGRWEGSTWAAITRADPAAVTAYWEDYYGSRPRDGESVADLERRAVEWWESTLATADGERIVVVTHIGVIRVLLCRLLGLPASQSLRFAPATASHTSVSIGEAGAVVSAIGERPWLFASAITSRDALDVARDARLWPVARDARLWPRARGSLRIALAGSAGTGKTTFGRRLAADLDLPFVEESMRKRLAAGFDLHALQPSEWRALMRDDWRAQKEQQGSSERGFVADRSSLDFAAFWLLYGLHEDEPATAVWLDAMSAEVESYDRILLFPWGVLPIEDDGVRSTNRFAQLRFQSILESLLERHAAHKVLKIPATSDFEERVRFVRAAIDGA